MGTAKPNPGEDGPTFGSNTPVQDDQGNTVVIPGGFHLDKDSGTSVEEGIVIEDSDGNQFVWIPTGTYNVTEAVDNDGTKDGKLTNNLSRRTFTDTGATEVSGDSAIDDIVYGEGDSRSVASTQIGEFKDSVSRNGGFYIGRYEQGAGNICKAGVEPYRGMTRDDAKSQAEAMYGEDDEESEYVVSELISSYAWDTALNFICQTNNEGYTLATTYDRAYGNFAPGEFQNTGAYVADNYSNICDLLGNCSEWTTEYSTCIDNAFDYEYPCIFRGNNCHNYDIGVGTRHYNSMSRIYATTSFSLISSRVQLYVK